MRLLVLDEAWQAVGGVDTFRRFLLPALAAKVEKLWWANPALIHPRRLADVNFQGIKLLDTFPPTLSVGGLISALLRRMPAGFAPALRDQLQGFLSHRHVGRLIRQLGVTHVLEICVFRHPFPQCRVPVIGMVHDLDYPHRGHSPIDAIFRDWLENATRMLADSTQGRQELLELLPSATVPIDVLASPPTTPVEPRPSRTENRWRRTVPVLYCPAVLNPRKNHRVLFEALIRLVDRGIPFHCYLSGSGTDQLLGDTPLPVAEIEAIRQICRPWREPLQGKITALGVQPWSVVEELYVAADAVVLPTRYEGFGLPLSEALRRDAPVVASQIPTFVEQVAHYDAGSQVRWVPAGDAGALAVALEEILTGAAPFPPFSAELQARLAAWTWEGFADRVIAAFPASA